MKIALIDTLPRDSRNKGSINLGLEIVLAKSGATRFNWYEKADFSKFDEIWFNIFYPTHIFNALSFLKRNRIEPIKSKRTSHRLLAGGQGVVCLDEIVDVFRGEFDYDENATSITSGEVISGRNRVVELTRGCKYKCKFCEYSWVHGGKYREKPIGMVRSQLKPNSTVNLLSANMGGYSDITELMEYCQRNHITVMNTDCCLMDADKIEPYLNTTLRASVKLGVESFDENVRMASGKRVTDDMLYNIIERLSHHVSYFHLCLIYGLPGESTYSIWFDALSTIKSIISKNSTTNTTLFGDSFVTNNRNIRVDFSITNFEPCVGTPYEGAPPVDFEAKESFLQEWSAALIRHGFHKGESFDYTNSRGRLGRKQPSYDVLMALKRDYVSTDTLLNSFTNGVSYYLRDEDCSNFLRNQFISQRDRGSVSQGASCRTSMPQQETCAVSCRREGL